MRTNNPEWLLVSLFREKEVLIELVLSLAARQARLQDTVCDKDPSEEHCTDAQQPTEAEQVYVGVQIRLEHFYHSTQFINYK